MKVRASVLDSDEAIVGILAHEMYELRALSAIFDQRETLPAPELVRLINAREKGGAPGNLHEQAWDDTNRMVREMRQHDGNS